MNKKIRSATTRILINADKNSVWKKVGFYEHVKKQPHWLLKLSLPTPQAVEGLYSKIGDTCRCRYSDGGFLTKRITNIIDNTRIEFEIIEQSIRYQNSIKLLGGYIDVNQSRNNQAIVNMVTYYENHIAPQFVSSFFIELVIKTMHKFVIGDMQEQLKLRTTFQAQPL